MTLSLLEAAKLARRYVADEVELIAESHCLMLRGGEPDLTTMDDGAKGIYARVVGELAAIDAAIAAHEAAA